MNKIKNIGLRIFNWGKKHRVLSILLCLLLIAFCFKGIVWIYNDIAYGRFVKVGEKYFDDTWHSDLYETYDGKVEFFIQPYIYTDNVSTKKIAKRLGNISISYFPDEIYNINKNFVFLEKARDGFLYILDKEDKKLEFVRYIDKFDNNSLNIKPIIKHFSKDKTNIINISNGNNNKTVALENTSGAREVIKLDNENLLFFLNDAYRRFSFKHTYKYSLKNNKIHKLDTSEISYLSGLHNKLVYLGNNKFLFLQNDSLTEKLTSVAFLTLVNNKFIKQELKVPKNNPPFGLSTDNPLVLNANQILFVGGIKGETAFTRSSKQCFLYDIKKNKILKTNNFPFRLKKAEFLKTKDGEFYIPVIYKHNGHTKHFIYKYKKGRFVS